ncbi:MAG: DUF481 domain-containing protein [Lacunisphaera sp.]|nr:DUF481 domain-containing protein [Lacunisphaera sp.]
MKFHGRGLAVGLFWLVLLGRAAGVETPAREVLVYPDGDRVQGRVVERTKDTVVFQSDRFGLLRVPAAGVEIIPAVTPADPAPAKPAVAAAPPPGATGETSTAEETTTESATEARITASLARLAAKLQESFKPWSGRFAFATEVVNDTAERNTVSVDLQLQRKWKSNEIQLKGRYDFSSTDQRTTTDMVKADGLWRHDFRGKGFTLYRPGLEWSRATYRAGVPGDYVLLQQEIGAGLNLWATNKAKVRTGVSENLFDTWGLVPGGEHTSSTSESAFLENELKLPWSLLLVQRGIYYYSIATATDGWENRIELTKKFTKTLSTALRHEVRRGSPDGKAQDYTRLRLMFGVDF